MGGNTTVIDIVAQVTDETASGSSSAQKNLSKLEKTMQSLQQRIANMKGKSKLEIAANLKDMASAGLAKIASKGKKLTGKAWTVTMKLKDLVTTPFRGIAKMLANPIVQIATIAGVGLGVKDTIDTFKSFQQGMANVKAISNATEEDFNRLTDCAKEMGETTMFSASQAAEAMENLAMAGWKADDIISGIPGLLSLAAAGSVELATASDVVSSALAQYNLKADRAGRVADILAAAATNSKTDVQGLGESLKYAGTMAGSLGYSLEDTAIALGLMGNAGVDASSSGSSVRMMFARMSKQEGLTAEESNAVAEAMKKVGVSLTDEYGKMKPMIQVMRDLRKGFKGMDEAEKAATASNLAGTYSMTGLLAIVNASDEKFEELTKAIYESEGAAQRMADVKMDTLQGSMYYLQSAAEGVKIAIGDKLEPYLRGFIDWLTVKMPAIKAVALDTMDFLGEKIQDIQKQIEKMTQSNEWKGATTLWDKIKVAWDKIIAEPFDEWWNGSGRSWLSEKANSVGKFMGNFLKTGLLTLLGVDVGDALNDGMAVGKSFMDGFLDGFDVSKVLEGIKKALKGIAADAGKLFTGNATSTSGLSAMLMGYGALKVGSLGVNLFKGGKTVAGGIKGIAGALKGTSAAADFVAPTAASLLGTTANVAGAAADLGPWGAAKSVPPVLKTSAAAGNMTRAQTIWAGSQAAGAAGRAARAQTAASTAIANHAGSTAVAAGGQAAWAAGAAGTAGAGIGLLPALGVIAAGAAVIGGVALAVKANNDALVKAQKQGMDKSLFNNGFPKLTKYTAALKANNAETYRLAMRINKTASELEAIQAEMQDAANSVDFYSTSLRENGILSQKEAANMYEPFNQLCSSLENNFTMRYGVVFDAFKLAAGGVAESLGGDIATISSILDKFKDKYVGTVDRMQGEVNTTLEKIQSGESVSSEEYAKLEKNLENIATLSSSKISQPQSNFENAAANISRMDLGANQDEAKAALNELTEYSSAYITELNDAMSNTRLEYDNLRNDYKNLYNIGEIQQSDYEKIIKTIDVAQAFVENDFKKKIEDFNKTRTELRNALTNQLDDSVLAQVSTQGTSFADNWIGSLGMWGDFFSGKGLSMQTQNDIARGAAINNLKAEYQGVYDAVSNYFSSTAYKQPITVAIPVNVRLYQGQIEDGSFSINDITGEYSSKFMYINGKQRPAGKTREEKYGTPAHAEGGIMTTPHLGLVAEDGAEAIIPLSGKRRERGLALWQEAGKMLGVPQHAEGGIVGALPSISSTPNRGGTTITVEIGGITLGGINVSADGGNPEEIIEIIREHIADLTDDIAAELAEKLQAVFSNMPLKASRMGV